MTRPAPEFLGHGSVVWAFLLGNWVIGAGVMLVPGMLDVLAEDLGVSVPKAGSLIGLAAVVMCIGAPVFAGLTARWDRRKLLAGSLVFYGAVHMLCALAPNFAVLLPLRMLAVVSAAIFTPQAAVTLGLVLPVERRASAITFVFLGWSLASVTAMPMAAWLGEHVGWRSTFFGFGALSVALAWQVARATPAGIQGVALPMAAWRAVARHPLVLALLAVTALSATGQFTTWAYVAPFTKAVLRPSPELFSGLLVAFGIMGMVGNVLASRNAGRSGKPWGGAHNTVVLACTSMALGLGSLSLCGGAVLPFCLGMGLWAIGVFASNSSQQARLHAADPALAGASVALNTSMIYLGQAMGTLVGGIVISASGYAWLPVSGGFLLMLAVWVSVKAQRRIAPLPAAT